MTASALCPGRRLTGGADQVERTCLQGGDAQHLLAAIGQQADGGARPASDRARGGARIGEHQVHRQAARAHGPVARVPGQLRRGAGRVVGGGIVGGGAGNAVYGDAGC